MKDLMRPLASFLVDILTLELALTSTQLFCLHLAPSMSLGALVTCVFVLLLCFLCCLAHCKCSVHTFQITGRLRLFPNLKPSSLITVKAQSRVS